MESLFSFFPLKTKQLRHLLPTLSRCFSSSLKTKQLSVFYSGGILVNKFPPMESSSIPLLLVSVLVVLLPIIAVAQSELRLPAAEQEAAYRVLETINPAVDWRSLYPDDLCLSGPHGLVCDLFPDAHVAELNFGYLSDFSANPSCGPNATLPPILSFFPFLRKLFLYNCFTGPKTTLPGHLWNLNSSSLEELVLVENPSLVGRLSGTIGIFPRLRRLVVSGTGISGNIPGEVGYLRNLEQLVLSRNRLRGGIPPSIGRCRRLKILDVSGNRMGGSVLGEIGRLGELVKLDLSSNMFSGPVPAELARLQRLEFLDLSFNRFTGGVPTALAEMVSLREVYLSGNALGGRIPEIWEKLGGIVGLGMSGLGLVGSIPSSMGVFLERLCFLALDNNFLGGVVPEQFKLLESTAAEINLGNNALEGRIPFSAHFVDMMGGKLKLSGNPKLCVAADMVGPQEGKRSLAYLRPCTKTAIPLPVLLSSGASTLEKTPIFIFFLLIIF